MPTRYTAGSFTKNFSWKQDFSRLHRALVNGFSAKALPVQRELWRQRSDINNRDLELIPMNFFLYSVEGISDDYILADRLVERAVSGPYDQQFAQLALFAFHLANSGHWQGSKWQDGRVAGWANEFIRDFAWRGGAWCDGAFQESSLKEFFDDCLEGNEVTKHKVLTNYRYMLRVAGFLTEDRLVPIPHNANWRIEAIQLFWDRLIFDGRFSGPIDVAPLETAFLKYEIYKLLGCSEQLGRAFVNAAFANYSQGRMTNRFKQLQDLKSALAA